MCHINDPGVEGFKIAVSWPTEVNYTLNPFVINKCTNKKRRQSFKLKKQRVDMMDDKKFHIVPGKKHTCTVPHKILQFWPHFAGIAWWSI